jgi:hypothetical protein
MGVGRELKGLQAFSSTLMQGSPASPPGAKMCSNRALVGIGLMSSSATADSGSLILPADARNYPGFICRWAVIKNAK